MYEEFLGVITKEMQDRKYNKNLSNDINKKMDIIKAKLDGETDYRKIDLYEEELKAY